MLFEGGNLVVDLLVDAAFGVFEAVLHVVEAVREAGAQFLA